MKASKLIEVFRQDILDTAKPYLVSDDVALFYLNEAQIEAARRARLITDSTSPVATASVSAGDPDVKIDPRIVSIRRIRLLSQPEQLRKAQAREMDNFNPGWDSSTSQSTPCFAVLGYETNKIRLHPVPAVGDELQMTVVREPMNAMEINSEPEIAPRWHLSLIEWMKFRAYIKDDTELYDEKKAARALGLFEQEFGPKRSASDEAFEYVEYHDIGEL